jgi:hypothetical protein
LTHQLKQRRIASPVPVNTEGDMKINKILLVSGLAAFSAASMAQPAQHGKEHEEQNHQEQHQKDPPQQGQHPQMGQSREVPRQMEQPHMGHRPVEQPPIQFSDPRHQDRDFRNDRDFRHWNHNEHRNNFLEHRAHVGELRIGQRRNEVLAFDWWRRPLFVREDGPFTDYFYAEDDNERCFLRFRREFLVEIRCY